MRLARSVRWLLLVLVVTLVPLSSHAGIFISVNFAPPVLPVYVQPVCPQPDLMWTPGYWAYGDDGYYWVPGAWVPAPYVGALWTPGYWGWNNGAYIWNVGYWGPHVGYYGGVNYGFGYGGIGFAGGMWRGGFFAYNTAVMHVGVGDGWGNRTYVDRTIVEHNTIINNNHVSYNGGPGGINHQPTTEERAAQHEQHTAPTSLQSQHESTFRNDHSAYAKVNGGHPQNVAMARPLGGDTHTANNNMRPATSTQANHQPLNNGASQASHQPMNRTEGLSHNGDVNHQTAPRTTSTYHGSPVATEHASPRNEGVYHPTPQTTERPAPRSESTYHGSPAATEHASPRNESVNHANPQATERPMERSENVNHGGGGSPHPAPAAHAPAAHTEAPREAPAKPEEKREH